MILTKNNNYMGNFKIREFRKAKGIYQDKMAEIVGLTQSNLSRYENNGIDLSEEQLDKLRAHFGKEEVDAYLTDSSEQIHDKSIPESQSDSIFSLDMLTVIKKQNETICKQVEAQNEFSRQLTSMNERLLALLEKVSFD